MSNGIWLCVGCGGIYDDEDAHCKCDEPIKHDPMCPNIPERWDPEASILWPAHCQCDLISKVRQDMAERCAAAFMDRITNTDMDDLMTDDDKDVMRAHLRGLRVEP